MRLLWHRPPARPHDRLSRASKRCTIDGIAPINAGLGDASFVARFGRPPGARDSERERIRVHLEWIEEQLRAAAVEHLHAEARERRAWLLRSLREYASREQFPRNRYSRERCPVFIDRDGRICAVGHLIELSAGRALANRIAARHRLDYVHAIALPEVGAWATAHGFSLHELAMIQPTYGGDPRGPVPEEIVRLLPASVVVGLALLATVGAVQLMRGWGRKRRPEWPRLQLTLFVVVAGYGAALWRESLAIMPLDTRTYRSTWCAGTMEKELYEPGKAWLTEHLVTRDLFTSSEGIRHGWTRFRYLDGTTQSGYFLFGHHVFGATLESPPPCSLGHELE